MIDGLKPYPQYKDCGVEWLGEVPAHWEVLPGHRCFVERKQPNIGLVEPTVLSLSYGRIVIKPEEKLRGLVPASFETYQIVDPGDIVCRPTDLQNDQVSLRFGLVRNRGIITSAYMSFRTTGRLDSNFGYLLLHAYDVRKIFYGLGSGLRQNLDWSDFKRLPCLGPPLPEQTAIVRFLDYVDRRVRRVIRARQRLVKLLEEYRQALIHQAVTGRIDVRTGQPYPQYKDSGVEWLGEVPVHWEIMPLKRVARTKSGDSIPTEEVRAEQTQEECVRVIGGNGLMGYARNANTNSGVIVIGRVGALCGNIHEVSEPVWVTDNALVLSLTRQTFDLRFLAHVLRVRNLNDLADKTAQPLITGTKVREQMAPAPPLPEQTAIVEYLDEQTGKIDRAADAARRGIELLEEFRTHLIADVVTGKLDVREVAARLPEEPEEPEPLDEPEDEIVIEKTGDDLEALAVEAET